ncbi:MAG: hypothetical protein BWY91_00534 [bacterium ADurb.BinA028]|nr:MAG: hypothetical protein BWY91_00534 [bacterium ADurb.BinA028]
MGDHPTPVDRVGVLRQAEHRDLGAMVEVGEHLGHGRRGTGHLQADVEAFPHAQLALRVLDPGRGHIDREIRTGGFGKPQPIVGDVRDDDVLGSRVPGDGCGDDPDRPGPGDEDVLAHKRPLQRRMGRVAERVEDRSQVGVDGVRLDPDIRRGQDDEVGERSVPVDADADGVDAHVAAAGPAVAAVAADDVPLARHPRADGDGRPRRHVLPDLDDLAVELVPDDHRCLDRRGGPVVPLLQVQVGAAEAGAQHAHLDIERAAGRLGSVDQFQAGSGVHLGQGAHLGILPVCRDTGSRVPWRTGGGPRG